MRAFSRFSRPLVNALFQFLSVKRRRLRHSRDGYIDRAKWIIGQLRCGTPGEKNVRLGGTL
jgi:hypothetical protein